MYSEIEKTLNVSFNHLEKENIMDNEIKPYCKYCKFNGTLGCQSTLICKDGNRLLLNTTLPAWQEKIIRQLYNIIMDEKGKRNKGNLKEG